MELKKKKKSDGSALGILIVLVTVYSFTPIIKASLILLALEALFALLLAFHIGEKRLGHNVGLTWCTILYITVCVLYKIAGISSVEPGQLVIHLFFFMAILVMLLLPRLLTEKQSTILVVLIIGIVMFNIIDNIRLCLIFPEVAAVVNRDSEFENLHINIGASRFYNGVFFFFTVCLFGFLNCKLKRMKYLLFAGAASTAVFIFGFCLKASVIVFTILAIYLLYFSRKAKNLRSLALKIVFPGLIAFSLTNAFSNQIIELISQTFQNERLAIRLIYMIDSDVVASNQANATVEAREELGLLSLNTWLDNPANFFFGIGDHRVDWGRQSAESTGIGQHADLLDSLARYGLIGLLLLSQILYYGFRYITRLFGSQYRIQLITIFLLFILFGLSKGVFMPDIGIVLFLFFPLLAQVFNHKYDSKRLR